MTKGIEHGDPNLRSVYILLIINQLFADSTETTLLRKRIEQVHRRALFVD
jgi:hypothetical protein